MEGALTILHSLGMHLRGSVQLPGLSGVPAAARQIVFPRKPWDSSIEGSEVNTKMYLRIFERLVKTDDERMAVHDGNKGVYFTRLNRCWQVDGGAAGHDAVESVISLLGRTDVVVSPKGSDSMLLNGELKKPGARASSSLYIYTN